MRVTKAPSQPILRCTGHSSPAHAKRPLRSLAYSHILMKACMQMRMTFSFWLFLFLPPPPFFSFFFLLQLYIKKRGVESGGCNGY